MLENLQKFATVKELAQLYPSFSESSIRYWLFNGQSNGLHACVRKLGKKVLINIHEFEQWINSHKEVTK